MAKKDEKAVVTEALVEENTVKEDVAARKPAAPDPEELVSLEIPIRENEEDDWFCSIKEYSLSLTITLYSKKESDK